VIFRSDFGPEMETAFSRNNTEAGRRHGTTEVFTALVVGNDCCGYLFLGPSAGVSILAMFPPAKTASFALRMMRKSPGNSRYIGDRQTSGPLESANSADLQLVVNGRVLLSRCPHDHAATAWCFVSAANGNDDGISVFFSACRSPRTYRCKPLAFARALLEYHHLISSCHLILLSWGVS